MNNIKLTLIFFLFSLVLFGQEKTSTPKNELKINAAYLIAGIPEIGYEYLINEESSFGVDLLFAIEDNTDIRFAVTPYYRLYFGKKQNAGFFAEGFGMFNLTESEDYDYYYDMSNKDQPNEFDFALGVAIGAKFITSKGFTFEFFSGIGRNLFNEHSLEVVPRAGLSFGKRF